jgi:hypothetical protein
MIIKINRINLTKLYIQEIMFSIDHDSQFMYIKDSSDMVKHVVYPLEAVEKEIL